MADEINLDLFDPFDRLLRISIRGKSREVPENNTLLRGFQYLFGDAVVSGRFCWNNECGNCELSCRLPGRDGARRIRGCQALVEEGMEVLDVSPDLALFMRE
jgi:hypothetical protein